MRRTRRTITVDGTRYLWARRHGHVRDASGATRCREFFAAWIAGQRRAVFTVSFVNGEGSGCTTAGQGWGGADGVILLAREVINLSRPAVAAALIRAARTSGWDPATGTPCVVPDGFAFVARHPVPTGY